MIPVAINSNISCNKICTKDILPQISKLCLDKWQQNWNSCTNNKLNSIKPAIGGLRSFLFSFLIRSVCLSTLSVRGCRFGLACSCARFVCYITCKVYQDQTGLMMSMWMVLPVDSVSWCFQIYGCTWQLKMSTFVGDRPLPPCASWCTSRKERILSSRRFNLFWQRRPKYVLTESWWHFAAIPMWNTTFGFVVKCVVWCLWSTD